MKIKSILIFYNGYRGLMLSRYLKSKGCDVFNVITKKYLKKDIIKIAPKKKIKFIRNLKSKKLIQFIKNKKFDLIISAGFPHIFKPNFFNLAKYGILNLHAGKLPKYRGGSPLVWQIINNEKKIGISIIKINKGIDTGNIICSASFSNNKKDNIFSVQKKTNKKFLKLTLTAIKNLERGKKFLKQSKSNSYFKQRNDKDARINFHQSNIDIFNFVRSQGFPYKGAYFFYKKKKVRLLKCKMSSLNPNLKSGCAFIKNGSQYIKCKKNSVRLLKTNPELKKNEIIQQRFK